MKLENQHTLDQEYRGFHEAIQQILPLQDKPRNHLGGLSFLFGQTAAGRGQRVNCKADNAEYASMRMLAVSNAQILRVGGAHELIFLMWQGCEYINIKE